MKFTIIHLWILACVAYGAAILMAFEGSLVGSVLFTVLFLLLLICTRWVTPPEKVESSAFFMGGLSSGKRGVAFLCVSLFRFFARERYLNV